MELSDQEYINRVCGGDEEAYRFIIRRYQDYGFAVALTLVKQEQDALEVVQSAFINAWMQLQTFESRSSFKTWFYRIVFNEALMFLRKQKRTKEVVKLTEIGSYASNTFEGPSKTAHISGDHMVTNRINQSDSDEMLESMDILEQGERSRIIDQCLKRVSHTESLALRLFYLDELSVKEISEVTGWSDSSVKVLLFRGRKSVRRVLYEELGIRKEDVV